MMTFNVSDIPLVPTLIATLLAGHGLRKRSLSPSGALAAFFTGVVMLSPPLKSFGVSLIIFYLVGSRATKVGKSRKEKLEEGHQEAGYRSAMQVCCNSFSALLATLLWSAAFVPDSLASQLLPSLFVVPGRPYSSTDWCPLSPHVTSGLSRAMLLASLGHFACCLGDTLASELGILSKSPPILITTLKPVPPGTNGGLSILGTVASLAGGFIMGLTLAITLAIENAVCRRNWVTELVPLLLWGAAAGGIGSLVDSFLGATVQQTRQSPKTKRIIPDEVGTATAERPIVINGMDILTNNEVNLVSSILTSYLLARFI
ncbi:integral membrane protein DUF92-domain-containing protein [Thelephora terrestris]|uniref:Integral membrane protein DUF92-domain-containing protein n=1 Tax=Thelephora terrestris TaxID=56493 RepID=A0A9P6HJK3_9AGAM|nr:integral membrane protein DUF92-domain-containing protein [Thelephora terrestris]